jgi:hypothetical protein
MLAILMTLGWKLAVGQREPLGSRDKIVAFLSRQKFDVEVTGRMIVGGLPLIKATSGACRLLVAEASPDGWNRDVIRQLSKTYDQLFMVYRGTIYDEQPISLTVTRHLWSRFLRKLGAGDQETPAVAVAANAACNARELPWAELRDPDPKA